MNNYGSSLVGYYTMRYRYVTPLALPHQRAFAADCRRTLTIFEKMKVITINFHLSLQERLSKSRNRERSQKSDREELGVAQDESPGRSKKFYRCYTRESSYSADNASPDRSHSASPQTQTPSHAARQQRPLSSSPSRKFRKLKSRFTITRYLYRCALSTTRRRVH